MKDFRSNLERLLARQENNVNNEGLFADLIELTAKVSNSIRTEASEPQQVGEASKQLIKDIIAKDTGSMIRSGFTTFDEKINGFKKGELVVLGGRPGMGKTSFLLQIALNITRENKKGLFFSLDLAKDLLSTRFLAFESDIEVNRIYGRDLQDHQLSQLQVAALKLESTQLYIDDSMCSILDIRSKCEKQKDNQGLDIVFVDYLQLISGSNRRFSNRESEVAFVCRGLKQIAKDFNVCVVVTSQLSRAVETRGGDRRPMLSDLRESGAIEQDADKVMFVYRPDYYDITVDENGESLVGLMELIVAKNRNGLVCTELFSVNPSLTKIEEYSPPEKGPFIIHRLDELDD